MKTVGHLMSEHPRWHCCFSSATINFCSNFKPSCCRIIHLKHTQKWRLIMLLWSLLSFVLQTCFFMLRSESFMTKLINLKVMQILRKLNLSKSSSDNLLLARWNCFAEIEKVWCIRWARDSISHKFKKLLFGGAFGRSTYSFINHFLALVDFS